MSWHRADGISDFCAVGVSAIADRCASRIDSGAGIPIGSASSILSGSARTAIICRCSGKRFGTRLRERLGSTLNTNEVAVRGASVSGWCLKRRNFRVCCERMNVRLVRRSRASSNCRFWSSMKGTTRRSTAPPGTSVVFGERHRRRAG
jgi:hypothetical protein